MNIFTILNSTIVRYYCRTFNSFQNDMFHNSVKLGGKRIPLIGLGTWQSNDETIENAVSSALEIGYRHFDTAFNYNNEEAIGRTLRRWFENGEGTREDVFITTKLPHIGNRPEDVPYFLNLSLKRLQLDYVDLYLIHLPFGFLYDKRTLTPKTDEKGIYQLDVNTDHVAVWKALEKEVDDGRIKYLGLSNFNVEQIRNVYENARIKPTVLQIELHAYMQQKELRQVCDELDIIITAYAPLGSPGAKEHFLNKYKYRPEKFPDILGLPQVKEIAQKYNKTPAQILLRHLVQQQIVVIPKSANAQRIKENFDIFDFQLTLEEIEQLNSLDEGERGRIFNFLFWRGVENHPQYPFQIIEKDQRRSLSASKQSSVTTTLSAKAKKGVEIQRSEKQDLKN